MRRESSWVDTLNKVDNTPIAGSEDELAIIDRMRRCLRQARMTVSKWREQAEECDNFYHGHQWDDEDLMVMRAQRRPPLTFNRIKPFINAVVGFEITNRQRCVFVPRHPELTPQAAATELATDAVDWALDNCNGHDERSFAFMDMLNRGMGWTEKRLDLESDDEGMFVSERVDGFEMYWDQTSRKRNLEDATWVCRRRWLRLDDVEAMWPDKKDHLSANADEAWDTDALDMPSRVERKVPELYTPDGTRYTPAMPAMREEGFVLVSDFQWRERETVYRVTDPFVPGKVITLSKKEHDNLQKRAPNSFEVVAKQPKWVYKRAFVCGDVVLEMTDCPTPGSFTYQCMAYLWDTKEKYWYGLTRVLIDPQKGANKWFSQSLHIFNTSPKGTVFIESSAIVNPAKMADQLASPNPIIQVRDGAISNGRIKIEQPGGLSPATTELIQYAVSAFKDVSGINVELLGQSEGNQPGVTMRQRQTQGVSILALAFQAHSRFRTEEAKQVLGWLREHLADGRWIRLGGAFNSRAVQLVKDPLFAPYDVLIDENPNNPNTKMEVWELMQPIIPVLVRNGLFLPEMLDYAPLPASIVASVKDAMHKREQAAAMAGQQEKGPTKDPRQTQAEIERTQAQTMLAVARAKAIEQSAVEDSQSSSQQLRHTEQNHSVGVAKSAADMLLAARRQQMAEVDAEHNRGLRQRQARHDAMQQFADLAEQANDMDLARRDQKVTEQEAYQRRLTNPKYDKGD
jgi:hypothetical protein